MNILEDTADDLRSSTALYSAQQALTTRDPSFHQDDSPGVWQTAWATFQRENLTLNAIQEFGYKYDDGLINQDAYFSGDPDWEAYGVHRELPKADPNWNPYSYMKANWSQEDQDEMQIAIHKGLFDKAYSEDHVETIRTRIRKELELAKVAQEGDGLGMLIGGFGAALTDISTYIPIAGWGSKAGQASRLARVADGAARGVAIGAGGAAIQELGLHQFQDFRTLQESWMNIGTAGLLGGGIGTLARVVSPDHPLNPKNPDNPLNVDNPAGDGVRVVDADGEDFISTATPESVGAAAAPRDTVDFVPGLLQGETAKATGLNKIGNFLAGRTIVGRIPQRLGEGTRSLMVKMADLGGQLLETNRFGKATAASAEDIKRDLIYQTWGVVASRGESIFRDLNRTLGTSEVGIRLGYRLSLDRKDFSEIARKMLLERDGVTAWSDADKALLVEKYGQEGGDHIEAGVREWTEDVHKANAVMGEKLTELGMLRDEVRLSQLKANLQALKAERDAYQAPADGATRSPDGRPLRTLTDIRTEIETAKSKIAAEMSKPKNLGREYGYAQQWDPATILAKQEEFEDALHRILIEKPDESWLFDGHGLTAEQWADLGKKEVLLEDGSSLSVEAGAQKRKDILREWAGDEYGYRLSRAELQNEAAQAGLKDALEALKDTMAAHGFLTREKAKLTTQEARKFRDRLHAENELKRAELEVKRKFVQTFRQSAEYLRRKALEEKLQLTDRMPDVGASELAAWEKAVSDLRTAEEKTAKFHAAPYSGSELRLGAEKVHRSIPAHDTERMMNLGEVLFRRDGEATAAELTAKVDPLEAPGTPPLDPSYHLGRLEERAKRYDAELGRLETELREREVRATKIEEAWRNVKSRLDTVSTAKASVGEALTHYREAHKSQAKTAKEALKELREVEKSTPLAVQIEDLMRAICVQQEVPFSVLDRIAYQTGRSKERSFHLNLEEHAMMTQAGFLRTDLPLILRNQYEQLSGMIGLHEGLGIREGGPFSSWDDVMKSVDDEYMGLTRRASDEKQRIAIQADWEDVKKDITTLKNRLLGTTNPHADPQGWFSWLSRKMRQATYMRYAHGFIVTSATDASTTAFTQGPLGTLLRKHGVEAVKHVKEYLASGRIPEGSLPRLALLFDTAGRHVGLSRMEALGQVDDYRHLMGIGVPGTMKHRVTSGVDAIMDKGVNAVGHTSGLPIWNMYWKTVSGLNRAYTLCDWVKDLSKLTPEQRTTMASLGIGDEEAKRLHHFFTRYGEEVDGRWDPNLDKWVQEPEGRRAARDFRIAVQRDMGRAVISPGIGDTPRLMDSDLGKLMLPFQTFAFAFMNRFMLPSSQRIAAFGAQEGHMMTAAVALVWSSLGVAIMKDLMAGRDPEERFKPENWVDTVRDVVDRSGLTAYMSPYIDSAIKVSAGPQEAAFGKVVLGPGSRYARNGWMEGLLGANFGLFRDLQRFGADLSSGDWDRAVDKGLRLTPLNTAYKLSAAIMGDEE